MNYRSKQNLIFQIGVIIIFVLSFSSTIAHALICNIFLDQAAQKSAYEYTYNQVEETRIAEEIATLKAQNRVQWNGVSRNTILRLLEEIAHNAGAKHLRLLNSNDILYGHLASINKSMGGFYEFIRKESGDKPCLTYIFERYSVPKFEDLSLEERIKRIKESKKRNYFWAKVNENIPQKMLSILERLQKKLKLPHLRFLQWPDLKEHCDEVDDNLVNLYWYFHRDPTRKDRPIVGHMLDRLGVKKLKELPLEEQLRWIKSIKRGHAFWEVVISEAPETVVHLFTILKERKSALHIRTLTQEDINTELEEIGRSLYGVYKHLRDDPKRKGKPVIPYMFDELGVEKLALNPHTGRLNIGSMRGSRSVLDSRTLVMRIVRAVTGRLIADGDVRYVSEIQQQSLLEKLKRLSREDATFSGFTSLFKSGGGFQLLSEAFHDIPLDTIAPELKEKYPEENSLVPWMFRYNKEGPQTPRQSSPIEGGRVVVSEITNVLLQMERFKELYEIRRAYEIAENGRAADKEFHDSTDVIAFLEKLHDELISDYSRLPLPLQIALGLSPYPLSESEMIGNHIVFYNKALQKDEDQKNAVSDAINPQNPLPIIIGPPGNGKTAVAVEIVRHIMDAPRKNLRILLAAPTHQAVDVLSRTLLAADDVTIPFVRLGNDDSKITDESVRRYWRGKLDHEKERTLDRLAEESEQYEKGIVFAGTITGALKDGFFQKHFSRGKDGIFFDVVVIDEAGMSDIPKTLMLLRHAKKAILLGDHHQLSAIRERSSENKILDNFEAKLGVRLSTPDRYYFSNSLLEELVETQGYPHIVLHTSYRAGNPAIVRVFSNIIYDGAVRVSKNIPYFHMEKRERAQAFPGESLKLIDTSLLPYSMKAERKVASNGGGYRNEFNAQKIYEEVVSLLSEGEPLDAITILTPYNEQVFLIRDLFSIDELRKYADVNFSAFDAFIDRISTIDKYQGDERDIICLDFVRSNESVPPETGFVGDYHRFNVALSRAKRRLIIVGDMSTLKKTGRKTDASPSLQFSFEMETAHLFYELEKEFLELEAEGRAVIVRLENGQKHQDKKIYSPDAHGEMQLVSVVRSASLQEEKTKDAREKSWYDIIAERFSHDTKTSRIFNLNATLVNVEAFRKYVNAYQIDLSQAIGFKPVYIAQQITSRSEEGLKRIVNGIVELTKKQLQPEDFNKPAKDFTQKLKECDLHEIIVHFEDLNKAKEERIRKLNEALRQTLTPEEEKKLHDEIDTILLPNIDQYIVVTGRTEQGLSLTLGYSQSYVTVKLRGKGVKLSTHYNGILEVCEAIASFEQKQQRNLEREDFQHTREEFAHRLGELGITLPE